MVRGNSTQTSPHADVPSRQQRPRLLVSSLASARIHSCTQCSTRMAPLAVVGGAGWAAAGPVEAAPAREADAAEWTRWCAAMGVKVHEAVEVRLRPDGRSGAAGGGGGGGSSMRARANIKANECFAVVPKEACLSSTTSKATKGIIDDWVARSQQSLPVTTSNLLRLSMTLMVERLAGRESRWGPYLATLPQHEAKLPIMWRGQERRELLSSSLEDRVENDASALEMAFEHVVRGDEKSPTDRNDRTERSFSC